MIAGRGLLLFFRWSNVYSFCLIPEQCTYTACVVQQTSVLDKTNVVGGLGRQTQKLVNHKSGSLCTRKIFVNARCVVLKEFIDLPDVVFDRFEIRAKIKLLHLPVEQGG